MSVLISCVLQEVDERPWFFELVSVELKPLKRRIFLSAEPLANLCEVFVIEHAVA